LRITPAGPDGDRTVEQLWFAPGTGLVRRSLELGDKVVLTMELKAFQPGKPDADPKAALAKFLQRDAGVTEFGAVESTEWVEPAPRHLRLRTRFAVVKFAEKRKAFCVRDG